MLAIRNRISYELPGRRFTDYATRFVFLLT
jgi:hypothetical protein